MPTITKLLCLSLLALALTACDARKENGGAETFPVRGVIREIKPGATAAVIAHEEITNFMAAMTMPFRVRDTNELRDLTAGDVVTFRLRVTENESWIEGVTKTGTTNAPSPKADAAAPASPPNTNAPPRLVDYLGDINFTNEFGRTVKWSEFEGQAIGFLFFFTRCPLPEYCPRLSKNLAGAQEKLKAMTNAPHNWKLLSITFEPEFDTPAVLRSYGKIYGADSNRWSFLTAASADIAKFARLFGLSYEREGGTINHDFRTVVVDAAGHVQAAWPIGGDTSDMLVTEIVKAARVSSKE